MGLKIIHPVGMAIGGLGQIGDNVLSTQRSRCSLVS